MNKAVLLCGFVRYDAISRVFEAVRSARPPRLYLATDGPRAGREDDAANVLKVQSLAEQVDWPCEVKTLFRENNLGCRAAMSGAIDWFFENEESGIILEDDCLPGMDFFRFCEELLDRYRDDERIMMIGGTNFMPEVKLDYSYHFSRLCSIWGWATWRRAWCKYDEKMLGFERLGKENFFSDLATSLPARIWLKWMYDRERKRDRGSWAIPWNCSVWQQNAVAILPSVNLVRNIGFDCRGSNTVDENNMFSKLEIMELNWPLAHPEHLIVSREWDRRYYRRWFYDCLKNYLLRKVGLH